MKGVLKACSLRSEWVTHEFHVRLVPFQFLTIQFQVPPAAFLEKSALMSFETVVHFLVTIAEYGKSGSHLLSLPLLSDPPRVATLQALRRCQTASCSIEPLKLCIERGFVTRLSVRTFLPEAIFGIYKSELLCL